MPDETPILIACPQQRRLVTGRYLCGGGQMHPGQSCDLRRVRCSMDAGRCSQTLCALHRYNRRGRGTWFPEQILVPPRRQSTPPACVSSQHGDSTPGGLY